MSFRLDLVYGYFLLMRTANLRVLLESIIIFSVNFKNGQ